MFEKRWLTISGREWWTSTSLSILLSTFGPVTPKGLMATKVVARRTRRVSYATGSSDLVIAVGVIAVVSNISLRTRSKPPKLSFQQHRRISPRLPSDLNLYPLASATGTIAWSSTPHRRLQLLSSRPVMVVELLMDGWLLAMVATNLRA